MPGVDPNTGEVSESETPAAGRPEQLRLAGPGMGRYEGVRGHSVLREAQPLGMVDNSEEMTVELLRMGRRLGIAINAPESMSVSEAKILKDMLDRAIKAARKIAEKLE